MPIKEKPEVEVRPERTYSERELQDFHQKTQRFYVSKTIQNPASPDVGKTFQILDWEALGVAYGAFVFREGPFSTKYLLAVAGKDEFGDVRPSNRYREFNNIWNQYVRWREKQDWVESQRVGGLEELAEQVPF